MQEISIIVILIFLFERPTLKMPLIYSYLFPNFSFVTVE